MHGTSEAAKLLDKLCERWVVERTGYELYELALAAARRFDAGHGALAAKLEQIRAHEKSHEELLEEVIRTLGGDPHAATPAARAARREAAGLLDVCRHPDAELPHVLHALLTAELVDNAGWELLLELARDHLDEEWQRRFKAALDEEKDHLAFIRAQLADVSRRELDEALRSGPGLA